MRHATMTEVDAIMTPILETTCRVDYRSVRGCLTGEHTSRLDSLSATGCTIRGRELPDTDALEMRITCQMANGRSELISRR